MLYPTLAISIAGSVPTYIETFRSHQLGVTFGTSSEALEQNKLWEANYECTLKSSSTIVNEYQVEIGATVCESGDVLLRVRRPEWNHPRLRWVSWDRIFDKETKSASGLGALLGTAYASTPARERMTPIAGGVLCHRWIGQGLLLQRVSTARGCVDEVVNTYQGRIVSSRPAPCNASCQ